MTITIDELHQTAKQHSERLRTVESAIKSFEKIANQVEKNQKYLFGNGEPGLDERFRVQENISIRHEAEIKEIREFVKELQPVILFYKVGVWMATILGVSILALIWSLITGQAELIIR